MNISTITKKDVNNFKNYRGSIAISAYIPTHPLAANQWGSRRAEYRTLLKSIKQKLTDMLDVTQSDQIIAELAALGDQLVREQRNGAIALFSDGMSHTMFFAPLDIPSQITLAESYIVRPLEVATSPERKFFVLTLSKSGAKLFSGDRLGLNALNVPDIQKDFKTTLRLDDSGKELQGHSSGKGEMYHGQDDMADNQKKYLADYFRIIDKAISGITGLQDAPIILAGVGYLVDLYRHISKNKHLASGMVHGNMQHVTTSELWAKTFPLAQAL